MGLFRAGLTLTAEVWKINKPIHPWVFKYVDAHVIYIDKLQAPNFDSTGLHHITRLLNGTKSMGLKAFPGYIT